jgi:hypothetical protein
MIDMLLLVFVKYFFAILATWSDDTFFFFLKKKTQQLLSCFAIFFKRFCRAAGFSKTFQAMLHEYEDPRFYNFQQLL